MVSALIALHFDFEAPTWWIELFFFVSNMMVKRHSDFIALGLLNYVGFMGDMVL